MKMKNLSIALALALSAGAASATTADIATDSLTSSTRLKEIVVTGSNVGIEENLIPFSVTKISNEQMVASGKNQVLSAISVEVPSLFVTQRNIFGFGVSTGGSGGIKIRGVGGGGSGVLMLMDGQPQFAGLFSHSIADFYGLEYVDHVEVLRGPGSVLYGSNAMGGVINVITKHPQEDGIRTAIGSQYGSYNTWLSYASNSIKLGKFSSYVNVSYDRTDGVTKGLDFSQPSVYAKIGYEFSEHWSANIDYRFLKFIGNDPIYPKLENPESTDVYHQDIIRGEASATVSNRYGATNGNVHLYYSYGNHFINDPNYFHSTDDRLGVLAYQNVTPWQGMHATIGFDFNRYTGRIPFSGGNPIGAMGTLERKNITEYSPYISLSQSLLDEMLIINAGLRMANSNLFSTQWLPQGGVSVNPGYGINIKANIAKGYRNPSMRELYLYPPSNPDLEPEDMWNYEAGIGNSLSRYFNVFLTFYLSKGSNMIQVMNGKNVNTGKFTNKGFELSASSHILDNLTLRASYSYLHTTLADLTGAPKNQLYFGVNYQPIKNLWIDADVKSVWSLFLAADRDRENFATVNARISYDVLKFLRLFVNFDNLTDTDYEINNGYIMPGFTVMGGFRFEF